MSDSSPDSPLRWGIVGCGDVVERKGGPSFQQVAGSRLVAVMRRSAEKIEAYASANHIPLWTTDAQQVIASDDVDMVYVATPPANHAEYVIAAAAAGKPVLVEKPAGRCAAETRAMLNACREHGVAMYVSFYRRYLPKFRKVREIIESGQLGPIVAINYHYSRTPLANNWRVTPQKAGGGRFYDLGCHTLDLLDDWFGPLRFNGGGAVNASPSHSAEDAVSMSFLTDGGAVGVAQWNFTAARTIDELVIEGQWGKLTLATLDCFSALTLEFDSDKLRSGKCLPKRQRWMRKLQGKKPCPKRLLRRFKFASMAFPHRPMIERVVTQMRAGNGDVSGGEAALRTAELMDAALDTYYGGRADGRFMQLPQRWQSQRGQACRRATTAAHNGDYRLSPQQLQHYAEFGYIGPFRSESEAWRQLHIPGGERKNLHLQDPMLFDLCAQPAVVVRAAQLLGGNGVTLMKSRVWVKARRSDTLVPWHQDVALNNGGLHPDGSPVQTVTVWMSINGANREKGAVEVLPGSQRALVGDWKLGLQAWLEDNKVISDEDLAGRVRMDCEPGEFWLFNSWVLHGSGPNRSDEKRIGLNMRFAERGDEYEPQFEYIPLGGSSRDDIDAACGPNAMRDQATAAK